MPPLFDFIADALIFVLVPWAVWRLLGRSLPLAVLPILIGLGLAAAGLKPTSLGVPSALGDQLGWIGVLLLAFSAGLEMRLSDEEQTARSPSLPISRLATSAAAALALPFVVGTLAAYYHFNQLPGWTAPRGEGWLGALAIGLCVAVSALPVLIGIVRELNPLQRPYGQVALGVAVIDDAVLWIGLALLLFAANGSAALSNWDGTELLAVGILVALAIVGMHAQKREGLPPRWVIWAMAALFLAGGAWASSQLGLHALLGAYFGGAMMAPKWVRLLPPEQLGRVALFGLAPLFFGHSGLRIDGDALTWTSLVASLGLLALSVLTKLGAVILYPPSPDLDRREALAVGALLQCKGLMEIVAATILRDQGLLSEHAYAALVTLAVLSTTMTGPLFRFCLGKGWIPRADAAAECPRPGN